MNAGNPLAYVGPGPGLTMLWAFLALMGTIALAVLSLLLWPIRLLIRKVRGAPESPLPQDNPASANTAAAEHADTSTGPR